jgi:hypothetical protein
VRFFTSVNLNSLKQHYSIKGLAIARVQQGESIFSPYLTTGIDKRMKMR